MTPRRNINYVSIQKFLISGYLSGHPAERLRITEETLMFIGEKQNKKSMKGAELLPSAI